jgi:hypothetical protein
LLSAARMLHQDDSFSLEKGSEKKRRRFCRGKLRTGK